MNKDCIFCRIVNKEVDTNFVFESDNLIVINDANPVADGHCLIITKKHYATLFDVPIVLGNEIVSVAKTQGLRLIKEGKADGIKLVQNNYKAAGQAVNHFHLHVIPHKSGVSVDKV